MKVLLSTAAKLKEKFPVFRDWESKMIERYGQGITSKTNQIWALIREKEKEKEQEKEQVLINNQEFMNDALKIRKRFDDYYKWQLALIEKYGAGIQVHLYSVWMETKKVLTEQSKKENENTLIEKESLSDDDLTLNNLLFWLKITCILLLCFSLMKLPIGYYTFLRIAVCGTAAFAAYNYYQINQKVWAWLFGIIAVIFNPLIPLYLGKSTWSVIDILNAMFFLVSIIFLREFPKRIKNK